MIFRKIILQAFGSDNNCLWLRSVVKTLRSWWSIVVTRVLNELTRSLFDLLLLVLSYLESVDGYIRHTLLTINPENFFFGKISVYSS